MGDGVQCAMMAGITVMLKSSADSSTFLLQVMSCTVVVELCSYYTQSLFLSIYSNRRKSVPT